MHRTKLSQTCKKTKPQRTKEKERLHSCPSQTSENPKPRNMKTRKSANSSDINLLEELLTFEASQSLGKLSQIKQTGSMVDSKTTSVTEQVPEESCGVDTEVLPLFQRLRLKSAKGISGKSKPKVLDLDKTEQQTATRTQQCEDHQVDCSSVSIEQVKEKLCQTKVNASKKCREVIVIDSDSDDESSFSKVSISPSVVDENHVVSDIDNVVSDNVQQDDMSSATDISGRVYSPSNMNNKSTLQNSVQRSQDTTLAAALENGDLTASATACSSAIFADETAAADYKLVQPDVTSPLDDNLTASATVCSSVMFANETAIADYKLIQPDVTALTSSLVDDNLTASSSMLSSEVFADETAAADYKLIQPDVTSSVKADLIATAFADETATTDYKLIQPDITSLSTPSVEANVTEQSTVCSSAIFADETATADYRLIQPELTTLSLTADNNKIVNNDSSFVVSSSSSPIVSLTSSVSSTVNTLQGETPLSSKSISKQEITNRNSNIPITQVLSSSVAPHKIGPEKAPATTPSCNQSYQSPNLTASSTNSYWCDDSQMSLFDSPSILDSIHNFTANNNSSTSFHKTSAAGNSNLTAGDSSNVNFSFPCVLDLSTPDIPEETPSKLDCTENKVLSPRLLDSKSPVESMTATRPQRVFEFNHTNIDFVSPSVMELNTPDVQGTIYTQHATASHTNLLGDHNHVKICENSTVVKLDHATQRTPGKCTGYSHSVNSQSANSYQRDNMDTSSSEIAPRFNPADMTCIPVPLNCDTPDISLSDAHLSSMLKVKTEVRSEQLDCKNQATPLSRNHHLKPHTLRMDNTQASCELTCDTNVVESHSRSSYDPSLSVSRVRKPLTNCMDQSSRNSNKPRTVRETVQQHSEEVENSPVCLLDRLRKKFDKCGDKKATLSVMTLKSKPVL